MVWIDLSEGLKDLEEFKTLTGYTFRGMLHPDDYGHYTETDTYGGIYYVFISDITEKKKYQANGRGRRTYRL